MVIFYFFRSEIYDKGLPPKLAIMKCRFFNVKHFEPGTCRTAFPFGGTALIPFLHIGVVNNYFHIHGNMYRNLCQWAKYKIIWRWYLSINPIIMTFSLVLKKIMTFLDMLP